MADDNPIPPRAPRVFTITLEQQGIEREVVPDRGTDCSYMMTTGARRSPKGGRRRGSYSVSGKSRRWRCPDKATRFIDGKPYCAVHGPSQWRVDPYYDTPEWRRLRQRVLERDHWTCQYCGGSAHQADHVIPRTKGGGDSEFNLVAVCRECNKLAAGNLFKSFEAKKEWVMEQRRRTRIKKVDRRPIELLNQIEKEVV